MFTASTSWSRGKRNAVFLLGRAACALAVFAAIGVYLAGCNTVKGLGRDVEAVAQGGQDIIDGKK